MRSTSISFMTQSNDEGPIIEWADEIFPEKRDQLSLVKP